MSVAPVMNHNAELVLRCSVQLAPHFTSVRCSLLINNNHCQSPSSVYLLEGPSGAVPSPHFLPACLFKVVFVYAEAQLSETCAGSVPGSFHRGSILFLIKWHSVAGGLAGTQLPGKPKNAGLHLATNSYCLRRLVLHSAPQCYCC